MPRKKLKLNLNGVERSKLERLANDSETDSRIRLRSRIVLMTEDGLSMRLISSLLGISRTTVNNWRQVFRVRRMKGLKELKRVGRPRNKSRKLRVRSCLRTDGTSLHCHDMNSPRSGSCLPTGAIGSDEAKNNRSVTWMTERISG